MMRGSPVQRIPHMYFVLRDALLGCRKSFHFLHVRLDLLDVENAERYVQVFVIFFSLKITASTLKFSPLRCLWVRLRHLAISSS